MFQRDTSSEVPVTTEEVWSWRANMMGFLNGEYPAHLARANSYVDGIKQANAATFEEPQFTIEGVAISGRDVLALTYYNFGYSISAAVLLHFDSTKSSGSRWSLHLPNAVKKDRPYVNLVMQAYAGE